MMPSTHFIASSVLAGILFPLYGWLSLLVFISGFFIDADHYLYTLFTKNMWSLRDSYKFYRFDYKRGSFDLHIFHTLEFALCFMLAAVFSQIVLILFVGYTVHMIMDVIHLLKNKTYNDRAYSLVQWMVKRKATFS
jgi:hypothetical protein